MTNLGTSFRAGHAVNPVAMPYDPEASVSRLTARMMPVYRSMLSDIYDPVAGDSRIVQLLARLNGIYREHSRRVSRISVIAGLATSSTITSEEMEQLAAAGLLHEVVGLDLPEYAKAQHIIGVYRKERVAHGHVEDMATILSIADAYDTLMQVYSGDTRHLRRDLLERFGSDYRHKLVVDALMHA